MDDLCRGRIEGDLSSYDEALIETVKGGDFSSIEKVTWGCHNIAAWLTQVNTNVGQRYIIFLGFNIKTYMYYVFSCIRIIKEHSWSLVSPWPGDVWRIF